MAEWKASVLWAVVIGVVCGVSNALALWLAQSWGWL
jgi:hypothetical protein